MSTVLVSGIAGFIGAATAKSLLKSGYKVVGIDNFSPAYDVKLKKDRLGDIWEGKSCYFDEYAFDFIELDISDSKALSEVFSEFRPEYVLNLAAQAGVRNSILNPKPYIESNIIGFANILEMSKDFGVKHLVYASSSSVYGANTILPFKENDPADHPLSLYAATKRSNELMAHSYSHIYNLPTTGLRFFTVYGPWGRPDMALFKFIDAIIQGNPIDVYNNGNHTRDFTYIDDIVKGITSIMKKPAVAIDAAKQSAVIDCSSSRVAPWNIYNIGNNNPIELGTYIDTLEQCLGIKAIRNYLPMQAGDVPSTYADTNKLGKKLGFVPEVTIQEGISNFVAWYKSYYSK